jgi:EAL and modified HD-GYP domain-containing signal transduction protein
MAELVSDLPLPDDVKRALLGASNPLKEALDLVLAYERADWAHISQWTAIRGLPEDELPALYRGALRWADSLASVEQKGGGQDAGAQA